MFCNGTKTKDTKCCWYDEDRQLCLNQKRHYKGLNLKEDGKKCNFREVSRNRDEYIKNKEKQDEESYIPKEVKSENAIIFEHINNVLDLEEQDNKTKYQNFIKLNDLEKVFVWNITRNNLKVKDAIKKIYPDIKEASKLKYQSKKLLRDERVIGAMGELTTSLSELIKVQTTFAATKAVEIMNDALEELEFTTHDINEYVEPEYQENTKLNRIEKIVDINKKIADVHKTYTKDVEGDGAATIVFAGGKSLSDFIKTEQEEDIIDMEVTPK